MGMFSEETVEKIPQALYVPAGEHDSGFKMTARNAVKNILLIWTEFQIPNVNFIPLGFGYISSNISEDYNTIVKDFFLDEYSDKILMQAVRESDPLAIGISLWEMNYQNVKNVVKKIKHIYKDIPIVIGGPSASSRKNSALDDIGADFAIKGEGERSLTILLDAIRAHKSGDHEALNRIPGLTYYDRHEQHYRSIPIAPIDLENISRPDYKKIRLRDYLERGYEYGFFPGGIKNSPIVTTRGCPYQCEFCSARSLHGSKVRTRPLESIFNEIEYLYNTYAIRGINIIDDNFTFHRDFVAAFCREALARRSRMPSLYFGLPNGIRMNTLDEEVLSLLREAGFESITIAPESGSDRILKSMKKNITTKEIKTYVSLIKKYKFKLFAFFIIGYPGETVQDIKTTIHFACSLPFDQITFSPFTPLPGTPVHDKLIERGEIDQAYVPDNYFHVTYAPAGITIRRMRALFIYAMIRSLALSPKRLFNLLRSYSPRRIASYLKSYLKNCNVSI
ncbi:MAG: radical SAM protein [Candidatus Omnitrophota bacterium]